MTLSRTNLVLAILLACTVVLSLMSGVDLSKPNIEILPDMKYSPAYGAYARNPNFPNGRTLQPPVPGTIARGPLPLHYEATPADALRAGAELENPLLKLAEPLGQAAVQRGSETFTILCTACHGRSANGDGLVPKYGFPPPPSLLTGKSVQMKDGQLVHILTYGQNSMPSFAAQLTLERRWEVIQYIRSLQQQAKTDSSTTPAPQAQTDQP